jgi:hypothetical protein
VGRTHPTIVGTDGRDVIVGTNGSDVIWNGGPGWDRCGAEREENCEAG